MTSPNSPSGTGHVIVDECHHLAATAYDHSVKRIGPQFWLGFTATPDRRDGPQASMPAAADAARTEHEKIEAVPWRQIGEVGRSMDNLMRVLERIQDPDGQLFTRTIDPG